MFAQNVVLNLVNPMLKTSYQGEKRSGDANKMCIHDPCKVAEQTMTLALIPVLNVGTPTKTEE